MGEEAVQYARGYALEAERKMGELLAETPRAKPPSGKGQKKTDRRSPMVTDGAPTLAELGITKREKKVVYAIHCLLALERKAAKERQREGGRRGGKGSGKLPGASESDARDVIGRATCPLPPMPGHTSIRPLSG
jgi:hypothetical protein